MEQKECTCERGSYCEEVVCLEDFSGNYEFCWFSVDWCPNSKKVIFAGAWNDVPSLACETQPPYCDGDDSVSIYARQWILDNKHPNWYSKIYHEILLDES